MNSEELRLEKEIKKLQDDLALVRKNKRTIENSTIILSSITKKEKCDWFDQMYNIAKEEVENSINQGYKTKNLKNCYSDSAFIILNIRDEDSFWLLYSSIPDRCY